MMYYYIKSNTATPKGISLRSANYTMWAIFIALFGGIFWAYKIGADKAASKRADFELDIKKSYWENWEQTVVDNELERRIDFDLTVPETAAKLKEDALNIIRSFYGLQYADFNTYYDAKYKDYYVRKLVAYIELVKHGKLPLLQHSDVPNYLELALDIRPSKRSRIEFAKWLENTMRDNGVIHATLYYKGEDYASFAWAPYVFDMSKAVALDDPNIESKMMGISTAEMDMQNSVIIEQKKQKGL